MSRTAQFTKFITTGILVVVSGVVFHAHAIEQTACIDIRKFDFLNFHMAISDRGIVEFKNGTAFSSDGGEQNDWKITIVQDEVIRPSAEAEIRMLRITGIHLTGSSSWEHVFLYQCRKGKVERIFEQKFLNGVKVNKISDRELIFVSGEWAADDPKCCPSREKVSTYQWDEKSSTYILAHSEYKPTSLKAETAGSNEPEPPYSLKQLRVWHKSKAPWPWLGQPEQKTHVRNEKDHELLVAIRGYARGGTYILFAEVSGVWSQISDEIEQAHHPVRILKTANNGWHDFESFVPAWGSGNAEVWVFTYIWNGKKYVLKNRKGGKWCDFEPFKSDSKLCPDTASSVSAGESSWTMVEGGTWVPSQQVLSKIKTQLEPYVRSQEKVFGRPLKKWGTYRFQYQGQEENGCRYVYINAFCDLYNPRGMILNKDMVLVDDGGSCFFQLKYDPMADTFFDLFINGEA